MIKRLTPQVVAAHLECMLTMFFQSVTESSRFIVRINEYVLPKPLKFNEGKCLTSNSGTNWSVSLRVIRAMFCL